MQHTPIAIEFLLVSLLGQNRRILLPFHGRLEDLRKPHCAIEVNERRCTPQQADEES